MKTAQHPGQDVQWPIGNCRLDRKNEDPAEDAARGDISNLQFSIAGFSENRQLRTER